MLGSAEYRDQVQVITRVKQPVADGIQEVRTLGNPMWCSVLQLGAPASREDQSVGKSKATHVLKFRRRLPLTYADNDFLWKGKVLRPTAGVTYPGHSQSSIIPCEEVNAQIPE